MKCPECNAPPGTCWSQSGSMGGKFSCYRKFQLKTYRVEWQVQVGTVDQYGCNFTPYNSWAFPSSREAFAFLPEVAEQCKYTGRWIPLDKPHSYVEAHVVYREVLQDETSRASMS